MDEVWLEGAERNQVGSIPGLGLVAGIQGMYFLDISVVQEWSNFLNVIFKFKFN